MTFLSTLLETLQFFNSPSANKTLKLLETNPGTSKGVKWLGKQDETISTNTFNILKTLFFSKG